MTVFGLPASVLIDAHTNVDLLTGRWSAAWARHPDDALRNKSAVFLFRKAVTLKAAPTGKYLVHVTADQRYRLYVNGVSIAWGPARGDLLHWRYETVDFAPYLRAGENVIAAVVHWIGENMASMAQMSHEAAFLMQGDTEAESAVNTPDGWKVTRDEAYTFSTQTADALRTYCVVGPGESFDAARHPWGWTEAGFDGADWPAAVRISHGGVPYGLPNGEAHWWLIPRSIPMMEETPVAFGRVVRVEGTDAPPKGWPASGGALIIPANTRAVLLFDHGHETCAFPEITTTGGGGATIELTYSEALFTPAGSKEGLWGIGQRKGDRNEVAGRVMEGYSDTWRLDGGAGRLLRPLWWKTFRYAELSVETGDAPVTIDHLSAVYTGYPFAERARFAAPEMPDAADLWERGWRTARLCAHETYMDCPYYEQLQYVGDTRIQCLVSLYTSGDHRLFRNALAQFDDSRLSDGLTQSRYPSRVPQVIAPFSLWYVGMVHDYWMHVPGDGAFVRGLVPGIRGILQWYRDRLRPDGLLGPLQWWCFTDWCDEWPEGEPPGSHEGGSSIITLQYALALQEAAELFAEFGSEYEAAQFEHEAAAIARAVRKRCYEKDHARVADTPAKTSYSDHASILAVLAGVVKKGERTKVMSRALYDPAMTQTTFYFDFYLNRALVAAGMGDEWLNTLEPWRRMREIGLTTWAEKPEPTRSDCHAWSASPNYEFLATVLGIAPAAPGWEVVGIAPSLGTLKEASGVVPHPKGEVAVSYRRDGKALEADISLPPGTTGVFVWGDEAIPLDKPGGRYHLHLGKAKKKGA
jgi:hypothetical protein